MYPYRTGAYIVKSADGRSSLPPTVLRFPAEICGVVYQDRIALAAAMRQAYRTLDDSFDPQAIRTAREFLSAAKPYVR